MFHKLKTFFDQLLGRSQQQAVMPPVDPYEWCYTYEKVTVERPVVEIDFIFEDDCFTHVIHGYVQEGLAYRPYVPPTTLEDRVVGEVTVIPPNPQAYIDGIGFWIYNADKTRAMPRDQVEAISITYKTETETSKQQVWSAREVKRGEGFTYDWEQGAWR